MATSNWLKDLEALAAARKDSGTGWLRDFQELMAADRLNREAEAKASFASDCGTFIFYVEQGVPSKIALSDLRYIARLRDDVDEIMRRLEEAESPARPQILKGYGLRPPDEVGPQALARMRAAAEELRENLRPEFWCITLQESRQMYGDKAVAALRRFLAECA